MTLMDKRNEVVEALQGIQELKAFPTRPKTIQFADTYIVQGPLIIDPQSGLYEDNWFVRTYLGQDELKAAQWQSDNWRAVVTAIETVAVVDRVDFINVGINNDAEVYMQITVRSE